MYDSMRVFEFKIVQLPLKPRFSGKGRNFLTHQRSLQIQHFKKAAADNKVVRNLFQL